MDMLLRLFKAISNAKRIKLMEIVIKHRIIALEDIVDIMGIPKTTCSRNLKILEKVKLVKSHYRMGKKLYELNSDASLPYNAEIVKLIKHRKQQKSHNQHKK